MSSENSHITLSAENLAIGYRGKKETNTVAEGINFNFKTGKLISLIGANGIGKSTLLKTLTSIHKPISGGISIKEKELANYSSSELASELSVVLTEAPSSKNLSVLEFVSLGRQPHTNWVGMLSATDKEKITWALENTDTATIVQKRCFELSDGQMQRVAIARALAQDTPIIILDEPTTHLDLYHRAYVLKLLKKLSLETNKTILFSTHEIDLAIQLSDEMIIMTSGKVMINTPEKLIEQGVFNNLFPKDTIVFDKKTGKFSIR